MDYKHSVKTLLLSHPDFKELPGITNGASWNGHPEVHPALVYYVKDFDKWLFLRATSLWYFVKLHKTGWYDE